MASVVLSNPDPQKFPPGTTVKAYKRSNWHGLPGQPSGTPEGSQDASATVASNGTISFSGLTDGTQYLLYAATPDRYASFSTPAAASAVTPGDGTVTAAKVAAALKPSGSAAVGDEALRALGTSAGTAAAGDDSRFNGNGTPNTQTGDYTLVLADAGKTVEVNAATTKAVTVPPNSSVAFPVGTIIEVARYGAGAVNIAAGGGVTIRSKSSLLGIASQYSSVSLRKRATDEWVLVGDLA